MLKSGGIPTFSSQSRVKFRALLWRHVKKSEIRTYRDPNPRVGFSFDLCGQLPTTHILDYRKRLNWWGAQLATDPASQLPVHSLQVIWNSTDRSLTILEFCSPKFQDQTIYKPGGDTDYHDLAGTCPMQSLEAIIDVKNG